MDIDGPRGSDIPATETLEGILAQYGSGHSAKEIGRNIGRRLGSSVRNEDVYEAAKASGIEDVAAVLRGFMAARSPRPEVETPAAEQGTDMDAKVAAFIAKFEAQFKKSRTLSPEGIFDGSVVDAYVYAIRKTPKDDPSLLDIFQTRAIKAGVDFDEIKAFIRAVNRQLAGRAIRLVPAQEILNMADPSYLIHDLFEVGGLSVLYSDPGIGKTFVVLAWCLCVAAGLPWFGRPVIQGDVVYVGAEGVGGLPKRLRALLEYYDLNSAPPNLYVIPQAVNLLDPQSVAEAIDAVEQLDVKPVLVVFDTYARSMVGGDENSAKDAGQAIEAMDRLRFSLKTAVMVVHHVGKAGTSERGSGALRGAADTMMFLYKDVTNGSLRLLVDKQKNFEPAAPFTLKLQPVGDSLVPVEVVDTRSDWTKLVEDARDPFGEKGEQIRAEIVAALKQSEGKTPIGQNDLLKGIRGNAKMKGEILHELAADPESRVMVEEHGVKKLYSIRPL